MTPVSEAERIIKLMLFIREAQPVSFAAIQDALPQEYGAGVGSDDANRRRFERDKRTLQENGVFLTVDQDQRYSLDASKTVAAPVEMTQPQESLLRLLCAALLEDKSYPFKDELRIVLVKLGDELELPDMLPQISQGKGGDGEPQGFAKVKKAINARKHLSFAYTNAKGVQTERTIDPVGAFFINRQCYVVGYDKSVEDDRIFNLDRMSNIRINSTNPKSPDFEERPFDVTEYFGLPFQFGEEDAIARIRLEDAAAWRAAQLTMGLGELEPDDDSYVWTIRYKDSRALAQWCIENGSGITILEPETARQEYRDGLQTYIDNAGCDS